MTLVMTEDETTERIDEFWDWIDDVLDEYHTTYHALERRAGVANAAVSRRARNRLPPTLTTYQVLAEGLGVSMRQLMVRAGDAPPADGGDVYERLSAMARELTPEEAETAIRFLRFWLPARFDDND